MKEKIVSILTLFGSTGTLVCCVLPIVVSLIAGGAAVSAMISAFPWLIPISNNKGWIFLISGIMLVFNTFLLFCKKSDQGCQLNSKLDCKKRNQFGKIALYFSIGIYLFGSFFAYFLVPIMSIIGLWL